MKERVYLKDLKENIGKEVTLAGFISSRRDHGKLIFLDLRDLTGSVQMVALPNHQEAHTVAEELRDEWVVRIVGNVNERPAKMVNTEIVNGDVEIEILEIEILSRAQTPPFDVNSDGREIGEQHRLQYRYLDLRRERMQKNIRNRHKANLYMRNFLSEKGFTEIETPILTKSTPEGARDFVVPSRTYPGQFYALPQSPQQYKQLLMVAGIEKYFQIARCMRDEDTRGDRQAEFTQLDIELSFPTQDEILGLLEELFTRVVKELYPNKHILKTPFPRLQYDDVMKEYGTDRPDVRENKDDPDELAFAWILNFPLFEQEKEKGHYAPSHHMFTQPKEEDMEKLDTDPYAVHSYQHDLVLNGFEIAGGSIRIHDPKLQEKIFDLIGFTEDQKKDFSHMLTAFSYGVPPHGGIASGLDRFFMILEGEESIREVMAFPKTGEGQDLMINAPSEIAKEQLDDLGLQLEKREGKK
jgi:aspartyl-tRNA synthetase